MNRKGLAPVVILLIIAGVLLIGATAWWYYTNNQSSSSSQNFPLSAPYKSAAFGGSVPFSWSVYNGIGDLASNTQELTSANSLLHSFSPHEIDFGDGAFEQVDFYLITEAVRQGLLTQAIQEHDAIKSEIVGGVSATIIQYPTDNGQVDKNGSGGKDYIIGTGKSPQGYDEFLLMRDWSRGKSAFESGLQHFLQTVNFTSGDW